MAGVPEGTVKMYSLDQVIYFLEQRQQTEDRNIRDAAIAYLKGYREVLPEYAEMKLDAVKNDPLTWDELKQMKGKPVWIEMNGYKPNWGIVMNQDKRNGRLMLCGYDKVAIRIEINKEGEDTVWQAYRKERV